MPGAGRVVPVDAAGNAAMLQQRMDVQVAQRAKAAGATPIRVKLSVNGKLYRLEKILALRNDKLYFEIQYSGWKASR